MSVKIHVSRLNGRRNHLKFKTANGKYQRLGLPLEFSASYARFRRLGGLYRFKPFRFSNSDQLREA